MPHGRLSSAVLFAILIGLLTACAVEDNRQFAAVSWPETLTPVATPTLAAHVSATPTKQATPTATPFLISTPTPTATPIRETTFAVRVLTDDSGEPLPLARVNLANPTAAYRRVIYTNNDGATVFKAVPAGPDAYLLAVSARWYEPFTTTVTITPGQTDIAVALQPLVTATISADRVNMRTGPGLQYSVLGQVNDGDRLIVRGLSSDNVWLLLEDGNGILVWVSGTYADVDGSLADVPTLDAPILDASGS